MTSIQRLLDSPLVAAESHLDQPAVVGADHTWTWRQIHAAALVLSGRIGHASALCNLCTSRVNFLVTWLAALRSRCLMVLPPSGGHADLAAVTRSIDRVLVVIDDAQALPATEAGGAERLVCGAEWTPARAPAEALAWQPAWDDTAAQLYTSGSTGAPEPQSKTLRHLALGALVLGERLEHDVAGGVAGLQRLHCSVPPQHMFGLECSVMFSLVHGVPVQEGRPLLPADVRAAFAGAPRGAWIATPLHLRSLVQAGETVPNCGVVIASTMPLTQPVAQQAEGLVGAPVLEIYGSTETGALAMRRTAHAATWQPMQGVRLESSGDGARAWGSHFASPVQLPDRVEVGAAGHFTLLGRQADLVKIAGRRASLAGLNLLLQELPGLDDGVFFLPRTGNPTERLCLVYAGPELDRTETQRWLRGRLDPVFLPRTLIRIDRLPRNANGKLQQQALERIFAQWKAAAGAPSSGAFEFVVARDHPALAGHFPGRPIVPGVLLLDRVLAQLSAALERPLTRLRQVKFTAALLPGEVARVAFECDAARVRFQVEAQRHGAPVQLASGSALLAAPAGAA